MKIRIDMVDEGLRVFIKELGAHRIKSRREAIRRTRVRNSILSQGTVALFAVLLEQIFPKLDISNDERSWPRGALRASDDCR